MLRPLALVLLLAGCATFPEVDAASTAFQDSPPPDLLPTDQMLAAGNAPPIGAAAAQRELDARTDDLRKRAGALRKRPPA